MSKTENKKQKRTGQEDRKNMLNKDILKICAAFALLFAALACFIVYYNAAQAQDTINNSYNKRSSVLSESILRGSILSADGQTLAYSTQNADGTDTRTYPFGSTFAHVVGFADNGGLGLESSYNYYLLTSHTSLFSQVVNEFTGVKSAGDSIVTTLDVDLQTYIYNLLGNNEGAVVVMDPNTGDIFSMVSAPTFDPNTINDIWESIISDPDNSVLYNRATQSAMTPGSTFKIFTLLEYYRENGGNVSDYSFDCSGSITYEGSTLSCNDGRAHGSEDIYSSFANSCNGSFANIGLSLNLTQFKENNEALLFNSELPLDIAYSQSSYVLSEGDSSFMVMQTSIGQGQTTVTPIHLALVTAAIANEGVLMKPRLVSSVIREDGDTVREFEISEYASLLTADEAAFLKTAMRGVVETGTASIMSQSSYTAYGKTGTADVTSDENTNYSHSWFTGFAEKDGNEIVVCVMIENSTAAGTTGAAVAKQIFDYYYN